MTEYLVLAAAALPAFVLARSATGRLWAAGLAAAAVAVVPIATRRPFTLSEAVGYAACVLALLAMHRSIAFPGVLNDALALASIGAAAAVRLQLVVLLGVLPLGVLLHELSVRNALRRHRLLAGACAAVLVALVIRVLTGDLDFALGPDPFPQGLRRSFAQHLAELALLVFVLPAVIAAAWGLGALRRGEDSARRALAALACAGVPLLVLAAASIDLRYSPGVVRDRYVLYAVPLLVLAVAAALVPLRRPRLGLLAIVATWLGAGLVLSRVTTRVFDWMVMTDELFYERLGISVADSGSPLAMVRGEPIDNYHQLYPLVISRFFEVGLIPDSLHDIRMLNAFLMTFVAVPAYLLAREVTGRAGLAFGVGVLSAFVPWLTSSPFLLTEVVAYPVFVVALLALYRAVAAPSALNDVLAVVAVGFAAVARIQFLVLLGVLPLAILLHEGFRSAPRRHRILTGVYAVVALAAIVLAATVGLARVLGVYSVAGESSFPPGLPAAFVQSLSELALGLAILPFVVAGAWLVGNARRSAFASVAVVTIVLLTLQVASFTERFGVGGIVRDRYFFYLAPLFLVALAAALVDERWPRWSLAVPAAIVALGFATYELPRFEKLHIDAPLASLHDKVVELGGSLNGARAGLVLLTLVLVLAFTQGVRRLGRAPVAAVLAGLVVLVLPGETVYAFKRLFAVNATSGRPLTFDQTGVFNWVDRAAGPDADVTMVPFPHLDGDFFATIGFWWDLEFYNRSVTRGLYREDAFVGTPGSFPRTAAEWDESGQMRSSPTGYVAQLMGDARFRIAGDLVWSERETDLIDAGVAWRLEWSSRGLWEDGWTRPDEPAFFTVYATPGQRGDVVRRLSIQLGASWDGLGRPGEVASTVERVAVDVNQTVTVRVCVPEGASGEVSLRVQGSSPVFGNPAKFETQHLPREGGLPVQRVVLEPPGRERC
ncbi:MAG: hypothetical protein WD689_06815 [Gaiellaceae bacterium]